MKKEWVLTQEAFDGLLDWLDADRECAGRRYETIRLRLIKIFSCRGCNDAEELADEAINRVSARVKEIADSYTGDPALYFYGVAQKVHLESTRNRRPTDALVPGISATGVESTVADQIEAESECLDLCMQNLPADNRKLVLQYYRDEKKAKIELRKRLASDLGIALNALRIRAHRIRLTLQQCVHGCLDQGPAH